MRNAEATPSSPEKTFEIVGVARNSNYQSLEEDAYPVAFYAAPQGRASAFTRLVIRTSLPPVAATPAMTSTLANVDKRMEVPTRSCRR